MYIGGVFEQNVDGSGDSTGTVKYYQFGGRAVAMRTAGPGGGAGTVRYLLADHLGSTCTVTGSNGTVVASQRYWPFGATRSGSITQTDKLYTGQRQEPGDSALGLYNYKARFYSTTLGRFASADSVGDGLNRYAYVRGNPLSANDPSGHECVPAAAAPACALPTPGPAERYSGTPIPGAAQADLDRCASNPSACLFWSVRGDWKQYIMAVAVHFRLPDPEILAAIILNEMDNISPGDARKAALGKAAAGSGALGWLAAEVYKRLFGQNVDAISYGIAQIQLRAARELEDANLVPNTDALGTIERLEDPMWAIFYAGAYLASSRTQWISREGRLDVDYSNDLIILYFAAPKTYQDWVKNGARPVGGETTGPQIEKVRGYLPGAVDALAVRLSR